MTAADLDWAVIEQARRIAEEEIGGPAPRCTGPRADRYNAAHNAVVKALTAKDGGKRFWLIVHEPGKVPDRKGSWPVTNKAKVLREFIAACPTAYLHVLTVGADGSPDVEHGPEVLQMLDGRSMGVGREHNARTLAAHTAPPPQALDGGFVVENTDGEFVASFSTKFLADFFVDEGGECYRHRIHGGDGHG